jgi:hypothetical protein
MMREKGIKIMILEKNINEAGENERVKKFKVFFPSWT